MKAGHKQPEIAKLLDRHKFTISRELTRHILALGVLDPSRPVRYRSSVHKTVAKLQLLSNGYGKKPVLCCAFNGVLSKLPLSCPSAMKPFISMCMRIRLRGERFGRTCAVRSKRENAMRADGTAEGKSPTDGL